MAYCLSIHKIKTYRHVTIANERQQWSPVADQDYEICSCTILLHEDLDESQNCAYVPNIHFE